MQVFRIDKEGYYLEPVIISKDEEIPSDCVEITPPQPCYEPRWTGTEWIEEGTAPVVEQKLPSLEERLQTAENTILYLLVNGWM